MKKLIATIALAIPFAANAEFFTGHKLLALANGNEFERAVYLGYVIGVHDAGETVVHCSPDDIKAGDVTDMFKLWMQMNRQHLDNSGDRLINEMLKQAFPCNGQQRQRRSGRDA